MPIHYACILNDRRAFVLHGMYERTQTIFKSQVIQNASVIQKYGYAEAPIESNLRILYHNWGTATSAIVVSHEVDRQECAEFCDQFK